MILLYGVDLAFVLFGAILGATFGGAAFVVFSHRIFGGHGMFAWLNTTGSLNFVLRTCCCAGCSTLLYAHSRPSPGGGVAPTKVGTHAQRCPAGLCRSSLSGRWHRSIPTAASPDTNFAAEKRP